LIEPLLVVRPHWVNVLRENLRARHDTTLAVVYGGAEPPGTGLAGDVPAGFKSAEIFRETVSAPPALVIFGAGDDAQPLVRMAKEIGWHVTVVDSRSAYATSARFPVADAVIVASAAALPKHLALDERTFVVIMTHRFAEDQQLLRALLPQPLAYLGVLGPRKRTDRLLGQLHQEGFAPDKMMLARLHAPVGLNLGGGTPETIALAILAEMLCRLSGRLPLHLRDCAAPIHG
jgi:xanthine dehydrogenase accessory factor